ncbi:LysR family transcriptional regulator [Lachnospiraceae bacterium 46-15]
MDITQLQYFKIIAECGSLTKAARTLHISQPAMSAMLKRFEEELDVELMKTDLADLAQQNLSISAAFCDPGVCWFSVPRFSVAYPDVTLKDALYENTDPVKLLTERTYDLVITPCKIRDTRIQSLPFLTDRVFLSLPDNSKLLESKSISLKDIPAQPLLYPEIGGYFLAQIDRIISENNLPITLVKNDFNITQYLIQTTNFLATISTLSLALRNDGAHRTLLPLDDPELQVTWHLSFLRTNRKKVGNFLDWASTCPHPI